MREKNPNAVALGKLGGSKGGKTRAARLSPEERSASARKAALARWARLKKTTDKKKKQRPGASLFHKGED
jgi:hypothetical protein